MPGLKLILLSCCAPCSCGAVRQLADGAVPGIDDFMVLFYNPNIFPESEYQKRLAEQVKYCESLGVKYAVGGYNHDDWLNAAQGLEKEPERGTRCAMCFKHRFKFAQEFAIEHGFNAIASVLGVSRHKDQAQVDSAASEILTKITYLSIDWDKFIKREIEKNTNFYRQDYCGCEFSARKFT